MNETVVVITKFHILISMLLFFIVFYISLWFTRMIKIDNGEWDETFILFRDVKHLFSKRNWWYNPCPNCRFLGMFGNYDLYCCTNTETNKQSYLGYKYHHDYEYITDSDSVLYKMCEKLNNKKGV